MFESLVKVLRGVWNINRVNRVNLVEVLESHSLVTESLIEVLGAVFKRLHEKGFMVNGIAAIVGMYCLDIAEQNGGIPPVLRGDKPKDDDNLNFPPPPFDPTLN